MNRNVAVACVICAWICQTGISAESQGSSQPVPASASKASVARGSGESKSFRPVLALLQSETARPEEPTGESEKVQLRFHIIEVELADASELGIDRDALSAAAPSQRSVTALIDRDAFDVAFAAMKDAGTAKQVARPTLIAAHGERARIHSGGEFPILVPQEKGTATIEWRSLGHLVEARYRNLGEGKLHLRCSVEHARADHSNSKRIQGILVPGLTTRRVNLESDLEYGGALVVVLQGAPAQTQVDSRETKTDSDAKSVSLCVITADPVETDER